MLGSRLKTGATGESLTRRRVLAAGGFLAGVGVIGSRIRRGSTASLAVAEATPSALDDDLQVTTSGWSTDFSKHTVNLSEITSGGVPRDGIPPIDHPQYVSIQDAAEWLGDEEPVISVVRNGQARAYPLQIMVWHEIVNDSLGGEPTLVTFCPLCNTAIAFDRRLEPNGTVYDFGTTGNLRLSDLVMWDRQTESWWQQLTGEAIVGTLAGRVLTSFPAQILGWRAYTEAFPDGSVLSRETGQERSYGQNPYVGYDDVDSSPFLYDGPSDDRMLPMERVVGITIGGASAAFRLQSPEGPRAISSQIGGSDIVILHVPGARSALDQASITDSRDVGQVGVFVPRVERQPLTLMESGADQFVDEQTGSTWTVTGACVGGPLAGEQLTLVSHVVVFWFAWAAAYPDTQVHHAAD